MNGRCYVTIFNNSWMANSSSAVMTQAAVRCDLCVCAAHIYSTSLMDALHSRGKEFARAKLVWETKTICGGIDLSALTNLLQRQFSSGEINCDTVADHRYLTD